MRYRCPRKRIWCAPLYALHSRGSSAAVSRGKGSKLCAPLYENNYEIYLANTVSFITCHTAVGPGLFPTAGPAAQVCGAFWEYGIDPGCKGQWYGVATPY